MIFSAIYSIYVAFMTMNETLEGTGITVPMPNATGYIVFSSISLFITFAIELTGYLLRGFGLYKLAEKRGLSAPWRAFVPFAALYVLGELTQFPDKKTWKTTVAWLTIVAAALRYAFMLAIDVIYAYNPVKTLFSGKTLSASSFISYVGVNGNGLGYGLYEYLANASNLFGYAFIILLTTLFISFVRNYKPDRAPVYWAVSLVFGLLFDTRLFYGIFTFVVRKEEPKNYEDYLRERYRNYYGQSGNFSRFDSERKSEEDPFSEFSSNDDEPFSDLGDKKGEPNNDDRTDDLF